jgi:hypothetical protein
VAFISPETAPLAWAQQSPQHSSLALYDNFDRQFVNPLKWFSQWQCGSPTVMECERDIQDGRLKLRVRDYGNNSQNQGTQFGVSELYLTSTAVTDISADVIVQATTAQACPANTDGAHGQALLFGHFFNGGGGAWADDVQAFLQFDRYSSDQAGVALVGGFLSYQGQFFDNVDLGAVNVGERVTVELKWDQPNHRFVVRLFRPPTGTITEQYMPYTVADNTPAFFPYKALSARAFSPNCVSGRTFADMSVSFDNVRTNLATAQ